MRHWFLATVAAVLVLWSAPPACAQADRLPVVASFSVLGDMVREIGGDRVAVTTLVGPNGDAHVFQPSPSDVRQLAAARLFVVNGLGLEGWLDRLVGAAGFTGRVAVATTGVKTLEILGDAHGHSHGAAGQKTIDPHAWQDLANGVLYVDNITSALVAVDPANAETYRKNGAAYRAGLLDLDARVRANLGAIPPLKRRVITSHDAFGYFGRAYGVTFIAPTGISTESEASAADVAKLVRQVRQQKIKALFVENVSDPRLIAQLAKESGAVVGPPLFSDALSPADGPAPTYRAMFEHNVKALTAGMKLN